MDLRQKIEFVTSLPVTQIDPLSGGSIGQVYRVTLKSSDILVAKVDKDGLFQLDCEGYMLEYLAEYSDLPVPEVLYNSRKLLLMSYVPGSNHFSKSAQEHAAELLARLHQISAPVFGFDKDTLIGGLHQPNRWTLSWVDFFREQRLLYMAGECVRARRLTNEMFRRIEKLCNHLDEWLQEPEQASLIHGDAWAGNILAENGQIKGFIDPAIYYADREIELAFTTLFGTFGEPFFARYQEIFPLRPGFFEERIDIYNLYPLLVHVRLFGGGYIHSVNETLRRFGF